MSKKKALIVTQEMEPYTLLNELSAIARKLPQYVQEKGMEIRVLMPRFGLINERRHRLHEVVRLSGMNIIVDDDDYPLIIKVASLPGARIQVYFLDNDDFFKRKALFHEQVDGDEEGKKIDGAPFDDNIERMVFFSKGVVEIVKKFGWAPDIVHCHGWMTSLIPFYIKTTYNSEPLFEHSKLIYSLYESDVDQSFDQTFATKAAINNLEEDDLSAYMNGNGVNLHQGALSNVDALIVGNKEVSAETQKMVDSFKGAILTTDDDEYLPKYLDFYKELMGKEEAE